MKRRALSSSSGSTMETSFISPPHMLQYDPCSEDHTHTYLNRLDVQEALHIRTAPVVWNACDDPIFNHWPPVDSYADTTSLFSDLYKLLDVSDGQSDEVSESSGYPNFKLLIYSGDSDGVCL